MPFSKEAPLPNGTIMGRKYPLQQIFELLFGSSRIPPLGSLIYNFSLFNHWFGCSNFNLASEHAIHINHLLAPIYSRSGEIQVLGAIYL